MSHVKSRNQFGPKKGITVSANEPQVFAWMSEFESEFSEFEDDVPKFINVTLEMGVGDKRFGFSVMGGVDEGFRPRIDELTPGSPADRADLEVGDEIVEVNGKIVENSTHAEIISHIHQSIKSRTISLRVKRKSSRRIVPNINSVQSAYVIAVEDQARQRLEKLAALNRVQPVDMTKISGLNELDETTDIVNNPIYVTTNFNNSGAESLPSNGQSDVEDVNRANSVNSVTHSAMNGHSETAVVNGYMTENGDDYVISPNKPHREMAIDVPETFIASKKERPSYPPPQPSHPAPTPPQKNSPAVPRKTTHEDMGSNGSLSRDKQDQLERIRKHQEELKKRREEENKFIREQEFLRNSIRESKKLANLEQNRKPPPLEGVVNPVFDEDENGATTPDIHEASTLPARGRRDIPDVGAVRREPVPQERQLKTTPGEDRVLASIQQIQRKLKSADNQKDVTALTRLLQNHRFLAALAIYQKVQACTNRSPPITALCNNSQFVSFDVVTGLKSQQGVNPKVNELVQILKQPEFQSLLKAHDKLAQGEPPPPPPNPDDEMLYNRASQYDEDSVKIVRLLKTADALGATVRNEGDAVIIGRIVKGGAAEKSGLLHEGDEILEINGHDMRGKNVNDVCDLMASLQGTLTFLIVPNPEAFARPSRSDHLVHIKAHFDYDPEDDPYIPCRELGLSFAKGDILHVINQEDANWWQAYREGEEDQALAGLIPSRTFQEHLTDTLERMGSGREAIKQTIVGSDKDGKKNKKMLCAKNKKRKKKKMYNAGSTDDLDADEILTYEEVGLYYPQPNRKRPIVLIGPPNVGRHQLRQRLMESNLERFGDAVTHTSCPRKEYEVDGRDYHFVQRHVIEADILQNKFVEHYTLDKNLYGMSLEAIRQVANSGKVCVLNLKPPALKILKASDLKPYVVFVAPPNLEKLRANRMKAGIKMTEEGLREVIENARMMEENYGHYFDMILVNGDVDRAFDELLAEINRLEVEPQWVPAQWINN